MRTSEIPAKVLVTGPACYAGTYESTKDPNAQTWSWYAQGANKDRLPHFTVGMRDEGEGGWFRFHVTVPLASGNSIANAHLFYIINAKQVTRQARGFTNSEELSSEPREQLRQLLESGGQLLDELAYAFWYGAFRGAKSAAAIARAMETKQDAKGNPVFVD